MPYLSFLAINYDIPIIVEVQKWFESCIVRNYANPIADRQKFMKPWRNDNGIQYVGVEQFLLDEDFL